MWQKKKNKTQKQKPKNVWDKSEFPNFDIWKT